MAWYSILPPHLTIIETWVIRICLGLAIISFSPWLLAILFDLGLYIYRRIWHEVPVYGGRARGETRPRAPSLKDGPRRRTLSLVGIMGGGAGPRKVREDDKARGDALRQRGHERGLSEDAIEEEEEDHTDDYMSGSGLH